MFLREVRQYREQPPHACVHRQVSLQREQVRSRTETPLSLPAVHSARARRQRRSFHPERGESQGRWDGSVTWEDGWVSACSLMARVEVAWAGKPATGSNQRDTSKIPAASGMPRAAFPKLQGGRHQGSCRVSGDLMDLQPSEEGAAGWDGAAPLLPALLDSGSLHTSGLPKAFFPPEQASCSPWICADAISQAAPTCSAVAQH